MYSEHLIAELLRYTTGSYRTGDDLDQTIDRIVVTIGRITGRPLGTLPTDASLGWWSTAYGDPAPIGTRAAIHVLRDGRVGVGLGPTRGVIETAGDHLTVVTHPNPTRYTGAYKLPLIHYGGLI